MKNVAMLSLHTSPLAQPGTGDGGGMNVYVRELAAALAQAGVRTTVYVRRWDAGLADRIAVEPLLDVVHIDAGPPGLAKEDLAGVLDEFADGVAQDFDKSQPSVIHANYWLSAVAGHRLKHQLGIPLVSTFHTLARVKAIAGDHEPEGRAHAEAAVIGCSDVVCVSNEVEAAQVRQLYGPAGGRIEIVAPGVDHAFFSPGDRAGARRALGLGSEPVLLFVGRIQPLKGLDVAVEALARSARSDAILLAVGGPSGVDGEREFARVTALIDDLGVRDRVRFVDPQPHHLLSTYYRAADLCVVPSRSESFGLVALEASACGTPVIASAVGGLTTLVEPDRTGILIDSRDPGAWARAVDRVLGDDSLAAAMSIHGARRARSYTWSLAAGRLRRLYGDLATQSSLVECDAK